MTLSQIVLMVFAVFLGLLGLVALGTTLPARPYRPHHEPSRPGPPARFRPDLPPPVARHFHETLGQTPPRIHTAVVWGRARIHLRGLWLPARFKAWYRAGRDYFRAFEITFYTRPFLRGNDFWIDGQGLFEIGGEADVGREVNQDQVLSLWAQTVWMPSVFVHDPAIRWEPVDDLTARLVVPVPASGDLPASEDSLLAYFDPDTACMTHFSALRRRSAEGGKEHWRMDLLEWKRFEGLRIPCRVAVAWGETGSPWSYWNVEGVAYNVAVSEKLP